MLTKLYHYSFLETTWNNCDTMMGIFNVWDYYPSIIKFQLSFLIKRKQVEILNVNYIRNKLRL